MKRYKSLLSLKWVAALLLVVGFVSCDDEEIISGKTDVIEGIETEIRNPIKRIGQILIDLVGKNRAEK